MTEAGYTKQWLHFKNNDGLIFSARVHDDNYPDMTQFLNVEGTKVAFPPDIGDSASRTSSFISKTNRDEILIKLSKGRIYFEGTSDGVWYEEKGRVSYEGPDISFYIDPSICQNLSKEAKSTIITENRIKVQTDDYTYVAVLQGE